MQIIPDSNVHSNVSGDYKLSVLSPHGPKVNELENKHPLENRLANWEAQQRQVRLDSMRRIYGLHEPIRREMELRLSTQSVRPMALGGPSNFHADILANREACLDETDIYTAQAPMEMTFQNEVATRYGL
ncbi:proteasome maturation factor Ump1 [Schizosaccharomyces octosporus yFS286]|uniref:Proteasome maturation factor Ump1 n=1 Tax=Schizosaccharomyces octosporus (strain yFS286) TaxID=483514 RepID=S9RD08_SCHOY|nr:proteasome maturation factor Ump1 [Schizosaccharomyces octosporus yFS286]EPX71984.1 proteasome maturation factor Ump1 [Schizosaccharomyces octosporus yFS286]